MIGKIELNILNIEYRNLDDSREIILLDVVMTAPYGAGAKARWTMTVPRGTAESYITETIKPMIKK